MAHVLKLNKYNNVHNNHKLTAKISRCIDTTDVNTPSIHQNREKIYNKRNDE